MAMISNGFIGSVKLRYTTSAITAACFEGDVLRGEIFGNCKILTPSLRVLPGLQCIDPQLDCTEVEGQD